mgnify:CR=1 FL=1
MEERWEVLWSRVRSLITCYHKAQEERDALRREVETLRASVQRLLEERRELLARIESLIAKIEEVGARVQSREGGDLGGTAHPVDRPG